MESRFSLKRHELKRTHVWDSAARVLGTSRGKQRVYRLGPYVSHPSEAGPQRANRAHKWSNRLHKGPNRPHNGPIRPWHLGPNFGDRGTCRGDLGKLVGARQTCGISELTCGISDRGPGTRDMGSGTRNKDLDQGPDRVPGPGPRTRELQGPIGSQRGHSGRNGLIVQAHCSCPNSCED